jgi:hypothetical protein
MAKVIPPTAMANRAGSGGKDVNDVRIFEVMNRNPAVMDAATAIR